MWALRWFKADIEDVRASERLEKEEDYAVGRPGAGAGKPGKRKVKARGQ